MTVSVIYDDSEEGEVSRRDTRLHDLSLRVTHKYVGTWKHEDQWRSIGTFEVLQSSSQRTDTDEDPDVCEPTRTMKLIKVRLTPVDKALASDDDVKRAIKDTMGNWGCSHEHDCCGCWNTMVHHIVKCEELPDGDEWFVTTHSIRNY